MLRLLPASYRADREDEMVTAFLEAAGEASDEDNPKPRFAEIASVAALTLRVRLGDAGGRPAPARWGDAVRLVALLGLLYQAALSCLSITYSLLLYTGLGVAIDRDLLIGMIGAPGSPARLAWIAWILVDAAVIAGYLALVRGHRRTAKILSLLVLALPASRVATDAVEVGRVLTAGAGLRWETLGYDLLGSLLAVVTVAALLAGFHRAAPAVTHGRRWLGILPIGPVIIGGLQLTWWVSRGAALWVVLPGGLVCLLLAAVGSAYASVYVFAPGGVHRPGHWRSRCSRRPRSGHCWVSCAS